MQQIIRNELAGFIVLASVRVHFLV